MTGVSLCSSCNLAQIQQLDSSFFLIIHRKSLVFMALLGVFSLLGVVALCCVCSMEGASLLFVGLGLGSVND